MVEIYQVNLIKVNQIISGCHILVLE